MYNYFLNELLKYHLNSVENIYSMNTTKFSGENFSQMTAEFPRRFSFIIKIIFLNLRIFSANFCEKIFLSCTKIFTTMNIFVL